MLAMPSFTWHNVYSLREAETPTSDGGPNLALNLWYSEFTANPLHARQSAFHGLYEFAYNNYLVAHFDASVAPPIPPSNYDQEAESTDWETRQEGKDDGEDEWDRMGFDTNDDHALAIFLQNRDGVHVQGQRQMDEYRPASIGEDDADEDEGHRAGPFDEDDGRGAGETAASEQQNEDEGAEVREDEFD